MRISAPLDLMPRSTHFRKHLAAVRMTSTFFWLTSTASRFKAQSQAVHCVFPLCLVEPHSWHVDFPLLDFRSFKMKIFLAWVSPRGLLASVSRCFLSAAGSSFVCTTSSLGEFFREVLTGGSSFSL